MSDIIVLLRGGEVCLHLDDKQRVILKLHKEDTSISARGAAERIVGEWSANEIIQEDGREFAEGEVVYVDNRPYGIEKTKIKRVTKTIITIEDHSWTFKPDGRQRGKSGGYHVNLSHPTPDLDKAYLLQSAKLAIYYLENHAKELSENDQKALIVMYERLGTTTSPD